MSLCAVSCLLYFMVLHTSFPTPPPHPLAQLHYLPPPPLPLSPPPQELLQQEEEEGEGEPSSEPRRPSRPAPRPSSKSRRSSRGSKGRSSKGRSSRGRGGSSEDEESEDDEGIGSEAEGGSEGSGSEVEEGPVGPVGSLPEDERVVHVCWACEMTGDMMLCEVRGWGVCWVVLVGWGARRGGSLEDEECGDEEGAGDMTLCEVRGWVGAGGSDVCWGGEVFGMRCFGMCWVCKEDGSWIAGLPCIPHPVDQFTSEQPASPQ